MPFVVDASVTASWLLPDEQFSVADEAYARLATDHALVPSLWWFEMRNLFVMNERRGRIDSEKTRRALELLAELPIRVDNGVLEASLLHLARRHQLTVYDSAYLELAQRTSAPLATLDTALANAARQELVPLIGG
jgi:predicted nucleic acid-binding protein